MTYFIRRGEQDYGPYTLADLQRYVASGNVSLGDSVRTESGDDAGTISSLLSTNLTSSVLSPAPPPGAYLPAYQRPTMANGAPLPPDLHWGLLLLLHFPTCGMLTLVWLFMQAWWVKQIDSSSKAIWYFAAYLGISYVIGIPVGVGINLLESSGPIDSELVVWVFAIAMILMSFGSAALYLVGVFSMRRSMLNYFNYQENIQLQLNGVLTFFFALWYFQYHMSRIAKWKKTGVFEQ